MTGGRRAEAWPSVCLVLGLRAGRSHWHLEASPACLPLLLHSLPQSWSPAETLPDPRLSLLEPAPVACPSEPCPHSALLERRPTDCRRQAEIAGGMGWAAPLASDPGPSEQPLTETRDAHRATAPQQAEPGCPGIPGVFLLGSGSQPQLLSLLPHFCPPTS